MNTYIDNDQKPWKQITVLLLAVIILGGPTLVYPFGRDQGEYAWIAASALQGKVIYSEIFNVKPPLTHVVHMIALYLFGYKQISIRILDLAWQGVTAFIIAKIGKQTGQNQAVSIFSGIIFLFLYYAWGFWYTAQTDGFITLPIAVSILLFLRAQQRKLFWLYNASGFAVGLAVLLKYPIGILVVLLAILEVTRLHKQGFIPALGLGIGFLFPIATTSLIMIFHQNFKDFIWIQFSFLSKYPAIHLYGASYIESIIRGVCLLLLTSTTIGWISIYCLYGLIVGRSRSNSVQMYVIVMWWIAGVVHLVVQNKFYGYHLLPILAPLALMTSQFVFEAIQSSQQFRMVISTLGLLLVAIPYATSDLPGKFVPFLNVSFGKVSIKSVYREDLFGVYNNGSDFSPRAEMEVAEYITAHTKLNENVFIWGFEPGVYFLSQRENTTRFIYNFPLYGPNANHELRQEFIYDLQAQKPVYILIVKNDAMPQVTATAEDSWTAYISFPSFYDFVLENYRYETTIEDFTIYRLNE